MKMKNEKVKDEEAKKQQITKIKAAKDRKRGRPNFNRNEPLRVEKKEFLIICEGKNTEPSYFDNFKLSTATIKTVGEGYNTFSLVERAIQIREMESKNGKNFDFVWCVFDADPKPDNPQQLTNFVNALKLAHDNSINVAYSNQAFEYWLILHFEDHQGGAMDRKDYYDKVNSYLKPLGCYYDGKSSKKIEIDFFEHLLTIVEYTYDNRPINRQEKAITRAKRNFNLHEENGLSPEKAESSTTVFKLVEELLKYL